MKIIQEREIISSVHYDLVFEFKDKYGSGFAFACDENGVVDLARLTDASLANYRKCLDGTYSVREGEIECRESSYVQSRIGQCECGAEVYLDHFTNTCDGCGRDYNMSGHELADRAQWGEETGESLADILTIP